MNSGVLDSCCIVVFNETFTEFLISFMTLLHRRKEEEERQRQEEEERERQRQEEERRRLEEEERLRREDEERRQAEEERLRIEQQKYVPLSMCLYNVPGLAEYWLSVCMIITLRWHWCLQRHRLFSTGAVTVPEPETWFKEDNNFPVLTFHFPWLFPFQLLLPLCYSFTS